MYDSHFTNCFELLRYAGATMMPRCYASWIELCLVSPPFCGQQKTMQHPRPAGNNTRNQATIGKRGFRSLRPKYGQDWTRLGSVRWWLSSLLVGYFKWHGLCLHNSIAQGAESKLPPLANETARTCPACLSGNLCLPAIHRRRKQITSIDPKEIQTGWSYYPAQG